MRNFSYMNTTANFKFNLPFIKVAKTTTPKISIPDGTDTLLRYMVGGGAIGNIVGSVGGLASGAMYNPDIIDPETGKTRKLGLLPRASLVLGGGALGSYAGALGGALAGGGLGLALGKRAVGQ